MLNRSIEADLVPYAQKNSLGVIVYSPMERGLLTGKFFKNGKLKENDHRHGYFKQINLEKVSTFLDTSSPIAEARNATLAQLVLCWTSLQPTITVVLAGTRIEAQAIANAQAMDINITQQEMQVIANGLSKI